MPSDSSFELIRGDIKRVWADFLVEYPVLQAFVA